MTTYGSFGRPCVLALIFYVETSVFSFPYLLRDTIFQDRGPELLIAVVDLQCNSQLETCTMYNSG